MLHIEKISFCSTNFLYSKKNENLLLDQKSTVSSPQNYAKPSLENLKANFLSFGSSLPVLYEKNSSYGNPEPLEQGYKIVLNRDLIFNHYDEYAEKTALGLAAGKKIMIGYKDGNNPDHFMQSFLNYIEQGKLKSSGLTKESADIYLLDLNNLFSQKTSPFSLMLNIQSDAKKQGKTPVFVLKDFDTTPAYVLGYKELLNNEIFKNLNIIGLTKKSLYSEESKFATDFEKIEMFAPSSSKTIEMLKNPVFLKKYIFKEKPSDIKISDDTIKKAVQISETCAGDNPGKSIVIIQQAISLKGIKTGSPITELTPVDIEDVFKTHPELKKVISSQDNQFEVIHKPKTRLGDVGGIKEIKQSIKEDLIDAIQDPEKRKNMPKGALFYGPPGTGKTLLAKAVAGEVGVPFISTSASSFVEKYVGVGAARVRELFSLARSEAKKNDKKTAIIFIDELDAVGKKRSSDGSGGNDEREQTLNQLLVEMDGIKNDDGVNVIVLSATNRLDLLDEALTRPGRFDMRFEIPNPAKNKQSRLEILNIHAKDKPFENETKKQELLKEMAEVTEGFSGAELADVIKSADRIAQKADRKDKFITMNDLQEAKLRLKFGLVKDLDLPPWSFHSTVAHEAGHGGHSLVVEDVFETDWEKPVLNIDQINLEPRGHYLGMVSFKPSNNPHLTFESLISQIVIAYGGYSIEKMLYGSNMEGVSGDLENASKLVYNGITKYGLGVNTGPISIPESSALEEIMQPEIKQDMKLITSTAMKIADKISIFNKGFIEEYVNDYKEGKGGNTLSGKEFTKKYNEWIAKNNKQDELKQLREEIKTIIYGAKNSKAENDNQIINRAA
jgi:cell division protease FtsH